MQGIDGVLFLLEEVDKKVEGNKSPAVKVGQAQDRYVSLITCIFFFLCLDFVLGIDSDFGYGSVSLVVFGVWAFWLSVAAGKVG